MHKVCCVIAQISSVYVRFIPKIYTKNLPLQPFPTTKKTAASAWKRLQSNTLQPS